MAPHKRRRWGTNRADFAQLSPGAQEEIARLFGGRRVYIPTLAALARSKERADRCQEVVKLLDTDSTYSEVAAAVGVSTRTVFRDAKGFTGNSG